MGHHSRTGVSCAAVFLKKIMGRRQAVRQRTLTPSPVGSNPAGPALMRAQKRYCAEKARFYRAFLLSEPWF